MAKKENKIELPCSVPACEGRIFLRAEHCTKGHPATPQQLDELKIAAVERKIRPKK
jgi:hypothetical protein